MPVSKLIISYVLTFIVFMAVDIVWLGFIAKDMYNKFIGSLMAEKVNWTAAIVFYLLFIVGIFIFAILPAIEKDSFRHALVMGAFFGFFTYATYDLTNLATLRGWPVQMVIIDIAWGIVLTSIVSSAGFYITKYFAV